LTPMHSTQKPSHTKHRVQSSESKLCDPRSSRLQLRGGTRCVYVSVGSQLSVAWRPKTVDLIQIKAYPSILTILVNSICEILRFNHITSRERQNAAISLNHRTGRACCSRHQTTWSGSAWRSHPEAVCSGITNRDDELVHDFD
jgi:hypothetical protein